MRPGVIIVLSGVGLLAGTILISRSGQKSVKGGKVPDASQGSLDTAVVKFQALVDSTVGWPYVHGGGGPGRLSAGRTGVDCSGYVTNILYKIGLVDGEARVNADWLRAHATPIPKGQQQPGDVLAFHGHVELVYSYPDTNGEVVLIGASGKPGTPSGRVHTKASKGYMTERVIGYYRVGNIEESPALV